MAASRKLAFAVELDEQLPLTMYSDSARLEQVLKNLLSNAFKFTQRGAVTLAVGVVTEGGGTHPSVKPVNSRMLRRMRATARPALEGAGMTPD